MEISKKVNTYLTYFELKKLLYIYITYVSRKKFVWDELGGINDTNCHRYYNCFCL